MRQGMAEIVALGDVTAQSPQELEDRAMLHALADDPKTQVVTYRALRKELKFSASSPAPTKNDRITRGFCLKRPTAR
jgi:hypothetical protein